MDPSMLEEIVFWNWWVFALVLIIVEVLVAGTLTVTISPAARPFHVGRLIKHNANDGFVTNCF